MTRSKETIEVSFEAGKKLWVRAKGRPANIIAYGVAGILVAAGAGAAYWVRKRLHAEKKEGKNRPGKYVPRMPGN